MSRPVRVTHAARMASEKTLCEQSFQDFIRLAWPQIDPDPLVWNWHIEVVADHLQAIAEGRINRLLINVPPGLAKTMIVSVIFTAWLWTRDPAKRIISACHNLGLATDASRKCRELIQSDWYQRHWPIALKEDENKKSGFENSAKGLRAAYALTAMTGRRGNIVVIDDPHSFDSAKSPAERAAAVDTFLRAVPNRLNDLARDAIVVVMQRLHEEDVSGAILARPDLGYTHLCIPMEAEKPLPPTPIGWQDHRAPGELLFESKFPRSEIDRLKASMGAIVYAGQYQQRPAPAEDGFFHRDWFKLYTQDELPRHLNVYMTSDHAPSGRGDYNVFRIWGVDHQRHLWLLDSFRERCLMDEALGIERDATGQATLRERGALPLIKKWKPRAWFAENDNTWIAIQSFVKSAMMETQVLCHIDTLTTRGGDKEGKASAYQAMASMGMVHLPRNSIGENAIAEYVMFPVGKHDDQVDADGAIARKLADAAPAFVPQPEVAKRRALADEDLYVGSDSDSAWG